MKQRGAANGGPATQIAIAVIDSATVMTAVIIEDNATGGNDVAVATWGVDGTGVHLENQQVLPGIAQTSAPGVAIGAGTIETVSSGGPITSLKFTRRAFTPIINPSNNTVVEVIDWQISSTGAISQVGPPKIGNASNPDDVANAVAGCMLPTGIPMTVWADGPLAGNVNGIGVGWFEAGDTTQFTEISGLGTGVSYVTATDAGDDFSVIDPYRPVHAYFVTSALTSTNYLPPSTSHAGVLKLRVWSYPIELPLL